MPRHKNGFSLDAKDFIRRIDSVTYKVVPWAAAHGLKTMAAEGLIRDAILEEPTVPREFGHLRRAQKIEEPNLIGNEVGIEVGFNTEYAAAVHEMPSSYNFTTPGSGPKYLEKKLIENKDDYIRMVAEAIGDALS